MKSLTARCKSFAVLVALLGMLAASAHAQTVLTNGVPVTGISGAAGSERFYVIEVPAGQDELEISISDGTGDVDLYVRRGAPPTTTSYDYRPYQVGNNETVTVANPAAGSWHIMLRGYNAYAGVKLLASYSAATSVKPLANGVPVPNLSGAAGVELLFSIEVPAGQTKLEIRISGGTGDADLYVKRGALPTTSSYDFRPFLSGNNETVSVNNPAAATWYIMIRGFNAFAGVTLAATYSGGVGNVLENGVPVPNLAGEPGSERVFRIDVPAGQTNLEIMISGGTGDADLYVKFGSQPTTTNYDYRPFLAGNNETVTIDKPAGGTWFIMIRGFSAYAGVTLRASYGDAVLLRDGIPLRDLSGALNSETFFRIDVPAGQDVLLFSMSGGTGNADMYIKKGARPTTSNWDYRPIQPGNTESVSIGGGVVPGTWFVMLRGTQAYSGVTLLADYSVSVVVTALTNGVPVKGISGNQGAEKYFKIEVPGGQAKLEIVMSGGTGDADLYVRRGSLPTTSQFDYRPMLIGNNESVMVNNPASGTWFILIRGHEAFADVSLVATYGGTPPDDVTTLQNGVPITGIAGAAGSEKFYKIDVPAGQASLEIMTSGGIGDVDLYVRRGAKPTTSQWDYRPFLIGNNETVSIDNPSAATYFIMLRGHTAYAGVTLKATYFPVPDEVITLMNGVPLTGLSGALGSQKFYKIDVPAGQDFLNIETSGGTGDVDLYVRKGAKPTLTIWDYRPFLPGNNEFVPTENPAATTWYIMLHGRAAYTGVRLVATYGRFGEGNNFASDPHCVALWSFESQALAQDSIGSNILTNAGASAQTTDFKEGAGSADFRAAQGDYMSIDDDHLSADFPTRSGDTDVEMSLCFWMKPRSFPFGSTMISKYLPTTDARSWRLFLGGTFNAGYMRIALGTGSGGNFTAYDLDASEQRFPSSRWYHVAFTYREADRSFHVRVWDDTAAALVVDFNATASSRMAITNAPLVLGGALLLSEFYDGLLDEVVVFDDVLTTSEIDLIRQGTYVPTE